MSWRWTRAASRSGPENSLPLAGRLCRSGLPCAGAEAFPADSERHCNGFPAGAEGGECTAPWRPLVLLIPLRLGLADVNAAYAGTLKVGLCRPLPSCGRGCSLEPPAIPSLRPGRASSSPQQPAPPAAGPTRVRLLAALPSPSPRLELPRRSRASGSGAALCEAVLAALRGEPLLTALLPAALLPDAPVPGGDRREAQQCPLLHRLRW